MLGTIAVVGLAPTPVLAGFAVFCIATAVYYRLPIPVQPMKAVAGLLTAGIAPAGRDLRTRAGEKGPQPCLDRAVRDSRAVDGDLASEIAAGQ